MIASHKAWRMNEWMEVVKHLSKAQWIKKMKHENKHTWSKTKKKIENYEF